MLVERVPGAGVHLKYKYKYDELFRRYIVHKCMERKLTECLFANASTRSGKEVSEFQSVSKDLVLTVSIPKTKHTMTSEIAGVEEFHLSSI